MTYEEAVAKMREGNRVRNVHFTSEEFFEMQHGVIIDEMGYNMSGWFMANGYTSEYDWQKDGWSVVGGE